MTKWPLVAGIIFLNLITFPVHGAPPIEACPPDSVISDDNCICDADSCSDPLCPWDLEVINNGTDIPGACCPIYACLGCKTEELIDGKCPCAPGAVINEKGSCECIDEERHLVNGECVCNPLQCELRQICDKKHVLTTIKDGCCRKTKCLPCPEDSESTNLDSDDVEDHCVCLPCKTDCGRNKTIDIKRKGNGFPGNCCDLYECKPMDEKEKDCVVGDIIYADGEAWSTADKQKCQCQNGLSLCSTIDNPRDCIEDTTIIKHTTVWRTDNDCTECSCYNGEIKCISHFCDYKETKIKENTSSPCTSNDKVYEHLKIWIDEKDNCTQCQCFNGVENCNSSSCPIKEIPERNECHPLSDCNKQCPNGFRISKRGCEICKCNPPKVSQELLNKYNISVNDLVRILDDHFKNKDAVTSSAEGTTTSTTSTTTTPPPIVTIIKRHGEGLDQSSTETNVTPVCPSESDKSFWTCIFIALIACIIVGVVYVVYKCYRNKMSQSRDITSDRGSYQPVKHFDNNNTIKNKSLA